MTLNKSPGIHSLDIVSSSIKEGEYLQYLAKVTWEKEQIKQYKSTYFEMYKYKVHIIRYALFLLCKIGYKVPKH